MTDLLSRAFPADPADVNRFLAEYDKAAAQNPTATVDNVAWNARVAIRKADADANFARQLDQLHEWRAQQAQGDAP